MHSPAVVIFEEVSRELDMLALYAAFQLLISVPFANCTAQVPDARPMTPRPVLILRLQPKSHCPIVPKSCMVS